MGSVLQLGVIGAGAISDIYLKNLNSILDFLERNKKMH